MTKVAFLAVALVAAASGQVEQTIGHRSSICFVVLAMARIRRDQRGTATLLSHLIASLIVAMAGSVAGAQVAEPSPAESAAAYTPRVPQPQPAQTPPPATSNPVGPIRAARARVAAERVRASSFFRRPDRRQRPSAGHVPASCRRASPPRVGALGADHGANLSAGVVVGFPVANRWFPYMGFGGGTMWAFGPKKTEGCDPKMTDCPTVDGSETLLFLHLRVGVGSAFGATRRHMLSLDVGGWRGSWSKSEGDAAGNKTESSGTITLPMAGVSYFVAL
jgi:hypothetical protein